MNRTLPLVALLSLLGCDSTTNYRGDATSEPDAAPDVAPDMTDEEGIALSGFMFTTRNLMDIPVYVQLMPSPIDELPMQRDIGAGWEDVTLWRPVDDIECPDSPEDCVCPTPVEPWQMREILPDGEYQVGWAPSPSPSSDLYVLDDEFCADCRCYRDSQIYPGAYAVTRCVYNDYRCTETEPCGPESVGYYRPAEPAGDMICARREFDLPGYGPDVDLPIDP